MSFEYWFMFPVGMMVATMAMSTLVGGATFFSPLFILILGLEPHVAVATALMIQVFGFTTGLIRYISKKCIDYSLGIIMLFITVPFALLGVYLSTIVNAYVIKILLSTILIIIGYKLIMHNVLKISKGRKTLTFIRIKEKRKVGKIKLNKKGLKSSVINASIGSVFFGITSSGLGELLGFDWVKKTDAKVQTIVSTTVFIIAITTYITSASHFYNLFTTNIDGLIQAKNILIFAVPGVIIGGILGTKIVYLISQETLQKTLGVLLIIAGIMGFIPI